MKYVLPLVIGAGAVIVATVALVTQFYSVKVITTDSMAPTIKPGTLVFYRYGHFEKGDVVALKTAGESGQTVVESHRLVGFTSAGLTITKGDNVAQADPWHEPITNIIGGAAFQIHYGQAWIAGLILGVSLLLVILIFWPVPADPAEALGI